MLTLVGINEKFLEQLLKGVNLPDVKLKKITLTSARSKEKLSFQISFVSKNPNKTAWVTCFAKLVD